MLVEITAKSIASVLNSMSTEQMRDYLEEDDDLSSEDTYVVQNDSTDATTISGITAIYKILGGV